MQLRDLASRSSSRRRRLGFSPRRLAAAFSQFCGRFRIYAARFAILRMARGRQTLQRFELQRIAEETVKSKAANNYLARSLHCKAPTTISCESSGKAVMRKYRVNKPAMYV